MLPRATLKKVADLERDNKNGASVLTQRALAIFGEYLRRTRVRKGSEFIHDLRELCGALIFAKSSMASIRCLCVEVLSTLSEYRDGERVERIRHELKRKLQRYSTRIASARPKMAAYLGRLMPRTARVLTLSYSSTVIEVLRHVIRKGKKLEVVVMESRPMFEGRLMARELARNKIKVSLVADAAMGVLAKSCDLAVVGADTVFSDGSVINKVGTYPLALSCREAAIPFYVVADTSKLSSDRPTRFASEERDPSELLGVRPRGLEVKNFYFDLTLSKYVTGVITETGLLGLHESTKKI